MTTMLGIKEPYHNPTYNYNECKILYIYLNYVRIYRYNFNIIDSLNLLIE